MMLVLAVLSIPLWLATNNPIASILLVTAIDLFAFGPTIRKCWLKPYEEAYISHTIAGLKYAIGIVAIENYNFGTLFYPIVLVGVNVFFTVYVLWRRKVLK